ncbi:hypothetical protein Vafri_9040, partial [Volvox africanus]
HQLARLLLGVDLGGSRRLAADGHHALSYVVAIAAVLSRLNWLSTMTLGSSLAAADVADDLGDMTAVVAAVTSELRREGGGDSDRELRLSPLVLHLQSTETGQQQPDREPLAGGDGGGSGAATGTARNGAPSSASDSSATAMATATATVTATATATASSDVYLDVQLGPPELWIRCGRLHVMEGSRVDVPKDGREITEAGHRHLVRRLLQNLDERHGAVLEPHPTGCRGLDVAIGALTEVQKVLLDQGRDFIIVPMLRSSQLKGAYSDIMGCFETRLRSALLAEVSADAPSVAGPGDGGDDGGGDDGGDDGGGGDPVAATSRARAALASSSRTTTKSPNACGTGSSGCGSSHSSSSAGAASRPFSTSTSTSTGSVAPTVTTRTGMKIRPDWRQRRDLVNNWALCCLLGLTGSEEMDRQCVHFGVMDLLSSPCIESQVRMLLDGAISGTLDVHTILCERVRLVVLECPKGQPDAVVFA